MNKNCIQSLAPVNLRLDRRRELKSNPGRFPVKLYVNFDDNDRGYGLKPRIALTPEEWIKINSRWLQNPELKKVRNELVKQKARAAEIVEVLGSNFTHKVFQVLFNKKGKVIAKANKNVYRAFRQQIDILDAEGREGTKNNFRDALNSFRKYRKKLVFNDITVQFLEGYESYMLEKECSPTTIAMYMRALRRIINIARKAKITDQYAFSDYVIPTSRNSKKSLDHELLIKFINYKTEIPLVAWAHALWCFSFFCNGMNITDVFNLKGENISKDTIVFLRKKTERTRKKNLEPVTVYITKPIRDILTKYGSVKTGEYVFDLLKNNMNKNEKYYAIKNAIRRINYHTRKIAKKLDMEKATTYVARHSWATTLMREGASIIYISKGLGHSSTKTTEDYLAGFTSQQQIKISERLSQLCKS